MPTVRIRFSFDLDKAVETMAYVVHKLGTVEKVKLVKLIYIADRDHFLRTGSPITGDEQYAMKWGPVPSSCLNALDGELPPEQQEKVYARLHIHNNEVMLHSEPIFDRLTEEERKTLDCVIAQHGRKHVWHLVDETHKFAEYEEVYREGTSTPIAYEDILKHYGDKSKYRHNRPVISETTLAQLECPFKGSESDL